MKHPMKADFMNIASLVLASYCTQLAIWSPSLWRYYFRMNLPLKEEKEVLLNSIFISNFSLGFIKDFDACIFKFHYCVWINQDYLK